MAQSTKKPFYNDLINRPMTRKDFLRNLGFFIISTTVLASAKKYLDRESYYPKQTKGFGSGSYGGKENS